MTIFMALVRSVQTSAIETSQSTWAEITIEPSSATIRSICKELSDRMEWHFGSQLNSCLSDRQPPWDFTVSMNLFWVFDVIRVRHSVASVVWCLIWKVPKDDQLRLRSNIYSCDFMCTTSETACHKHTLVFLARLDLTGRMDFLKVILFQIVSLQKFQHSPCYTTTERARRRPMVLSVT